MKILFLALLSLSAFSCNQKSSKTQENMNNPISPKIADNSIITGNWTMCSTLGDGMVTQMNVCTEVVFKPDGTGFVQKPSLMVENFKWVFNKPELNIFYSEKKITTTFPDTTYYVKFSKRADRADLTLTHKGQSYFLSRYIEPKFRNDSIKLVISASSSSPSQSSYHSH